jgi:hypothetical protein
MVHWYFFGRVQSKRVTTTQPLRAEECARLSLSATGGQALKTVLLHLRPDAIGCRTAHFYKCILTWVKARDRCAARRNPRVPTRGFVKGITIRIQKLCFQELEPAHCNWSVLAFAPEAAAADQVPWIAANASKTSGRWLSISLRSEDFDHGILFGIQFDVHLLWAGSRPSSLVWEAASATSGHLQKRDFKLSGERSQFSRIAEAFFG